MNYQEASALLTGRCKNRRKLGNNTYLERHDDFIAIRLHATDILSFFPDGRIELDTGGWHTVTTRGRMNYYLPRPWNAWSEGTGMERAGQFSSKATSPWSS